VRAGRSRSDFSKTASRSSTSRRNSLLGSGSSTPVTIVRPTPTMPTRSRQLPSAPRPCGCCNSTGNSKPCGCSPTAAKHSPDVGSRPSTGCRPCSQNSFQDRPNATSPPARPRQCWPQSGRVTSPERPAAASPPYRCRGARRTRCGRGQDQAVHRRAEDPRPGPRLPADGHPRRRTRRGRPDPGRRR
jgi:hypothetical protein